MSQITHAPSDMRLWAIRHKPSGQWILQRTRLRGGTFEEPGAWTTRRHPRMFPNPGNARKALTAWLSGKWREINTQDSYTGEWDLYLDVKLVPERKREEMEIVEVLVVLQEGGL